MLEKLLSSRTRLLELCTDLPLERIEQKPQPNLWAVGEIVEHLATVEIWATSSIKKRLLEPESPTEAIDSTRALNDIIQYAVGQRTHKVKAPDSASPRGAFGPWPGSLENFLKSRDSSLALATADSAALESRILVHPILGNMTLRQWLEFLAAHTERHCLQIEEHLRLNH
ncbi:MAG: DinB family protein [Acidobacteriota bacterium]